MYVYMYIHTSLAPVCFLTGVETTTSETTSSVENVAAWNLLKKLLYGFHNPIQQLQTDGLINLQLQTSCVVVAPRWPDFYCCCDLLLHRSSQHFVSCSIFLFNFSVSPCRHAQQYPPSLGAACKHLWFCKRHGERTNLFPWCFMLSNVDFFRQIKERSI